jgi:thiamine biosynthesis lipoprotein
VLFGIGGDLAVHGPVPADGWLVHVTDDHRSAPGAPGQPVSLHTGGLATSSTTVRRWRRGQAQVHHILDPATGMPAPEIWRTVSVAAHNCVQANVASTAAIVLGADAPAWLRRAGVAARLCALDGSVERVGGWPEDGDTECGS